MQEFKPAWTARGQVHLSYLKIAVSDNYSGSSSLGLPFLVIGVKLVDLVQSLKFGSSHVAGIQQGKNANPRKILVFSATRSSRWERKRESTKGSAESISYY